MHKNRIVNENNTENSGILTKNNSEKFISPVKSITALIDFLNNGKSKAGHYYPVYIVDKRGSPLFFIKTIPEFEINFRGESITIKQLHDLLEQIPKQ